MSGGPHLGEADLRYLDLLQGVIARLSTSSFLVKGWCITLNGVIIALSNQGAGWRSVPVAVAMTLGFWLLDGYYLRQERLFRALYEKVVTASADPPPAFTMDAERYGGPMAWPGVLLARPMLLCYGLLTTAGGLLISLPG